MSIDKGNRLYIKSKAVEEFGLLELIRTFYEVGYQRGFTEYKPSLGAIKLLKKDKLTTFTIDDQIKLEVLQQKHEERPHIRVIEGKIVQSKREKSQELIDLENKVKGEFEFGDVDMNATIDEEVFDQMKPEDIDALQKDYESTGREIAEMERSLNQ